MSEIDKKRERALRRLKRGKKRIFGTEKRPRLALTRSNRHIYAQLIDDSKGKSLGMVSTVSKNPKGKAGLYTNAKYAAELADSVYELCKKKKVEEISLDRRGRKYGPVLKSFADKLREKGIKF